VTFPLPVVTSPYPSLRFSPALQKLTVVGTAVAVLALTGCTGVAPSKTTTAAATGAAIGGIGGAVVGNNSSLGSGAGIIGGAVAGALVGGVVGMVQEAHERKEQDRLSQERAYQQELARKRASEAKIKSEMDEELAIAQGFRISDMELADAQRKKEDADGRLKQLRDERAGALARKKTLDELKEKQLSDEAEIARLEEELTRLKGDNPALNAGPAPAASGAPAAPPPAKPGV
jgi:hypothetical protein